MSTNLQSKVSLWESLVTKAHQIVHGGPTESVPTDGGQVRSFAKLMADKDAEINSRYGNAIAQTESAASRATAAMVHAEAARDAATAVGKVFTSIALGLAGTVSGQSFSVLGADAQDLIIYTNAAGVATELLRFKTKAFLDSLGFDTTYAPRLGFAAAWLDSTGALAFGIRTDGRIIFGRGGDVAARLDTLDGVVNGIGTLATLIGVLTVDTDYRRSGYYMPWLDSQGRLAGGLASNGDLMTKGRNVTARLAELDGITSGNSAAIAEATKWTTSNATLVAWGDSITAGAGGTPWPTILGQSLGRTVVNKGVGGQGALSIAMRQGSITAFLTVNNNTIPAAGSVAVTARTASPIDSLMPVQTMAGKLGGIPGTLARATDNSYTFTRTTAGAARSIPTLTPFIPDTGDLDFATTLLMVGTNGVYTDPQTVIQTVTKMVAFLKPINKRFVVLSLLNGGNEASRFSGTTGYTNTMVANDYFRTTWPDNYLDVRRVLINSYNPALPQDVIDFGHDVTPTSLSADTIHLNTAGYTIVAGAVQQFLTDKSW